MHRDDNATDPQSQGLNFDALLAYRDVLLDVLAATRDDALRAQTEAVLAELGELLALKAAE